ncbi:MAG: YciI family protein [Rickettsiales bacterium]|nr:YciI family protein [Rickettsiales bacterium]
MQFLILAYDAKDSGAAQRRMDAREAHLALIAKYKASGNMKMGAAILDDAGAMKGSCIIAEFPSRAELEAWLAEEPYMLQNVWGDVQVQVCKIAPSFVH